MNVCEQCGREFKADKPGRKYCSSECYHKAQVGHKGYNAKAPTIATCAWCGKEFETGGRGRPKKGQRFCSNSCMAHARVRKPAVNEMTVAQAAYLAGLIDGEGSIVIARKKDKGRNTWRLQVSNTYRPLLEWCVEATGVGSIVLHKNENPKWADSMWWNCYSWNAYDVLRQIVPYMIIKKELALRMMSELDEIRRVSSSTVP